jgi:pimeloyl-ACP methyl ester carboxylesterase
MRDSRLSIRFRYVALAIVILASAVFAQNNQFSASGQQGDYSKPKSKPDIRRKPSIVRPRANMAAPMGSPMTAPFNVSGFWVDLFNNTYALIQDQYGDITGTVRPNVPPNGCPVPIWPVSGYTSGNSFELMATNPDGGDAVCVQWVQQYATVISPLAAVGLWGNNTDIFGYTEINTLYRRGLVDPVGSNPPLLSGNAVTQDAGAIAASPAPAYVTGAAADGVTQLIVEVPAMQAGDSVQLTLMNENGAQDIVANDGGLFPLGGSPGDASSALTVTAQSTNQGGPSPMAFAIWVAPTNYDRNPPGATTYPQDATSVQRNLTLQAQYPNPDGSTFTVSETISVVRPPVVLIHGLWSSGQGTWGNFYPANPQNLGLWNAINPQQNEVDYSAPVPVAAITPPYPWFSSNPTSITQAAIGFNYNAPCVLLQLQAFIANYEQSWAVAAVQADVVGHSMGGDITRAMPTAPPGTCSASFANQNNYGLGPIHKLITIGTPHRGTPVAVDLLPSGLGDPNYCVRDILDTKSNASFQTVTLGTGGVVPGAVGDLAAAPANLPATEPFPMAYLAGTTNAANLANIDTALPPNDSFKLRAICYLPTGSPLAYDLTPSLWNNVFGGEANDGVVPLSSQLNATGSTSANTLPGVIHSPGFEALNFSPPTEVSPQSGIPDAVVNLLNEATNGPDFH